MIAKLHVALPVLVPFKGEYGSAICFLFFCQIKILHLGSFVAMETIKDNAHKTKVPFEL